MVYTWSWNGSIPFESIYWTNNYQTYVIVYFGYKQIACLKKYAEHEKQEQQRLNYVILNWMMC